MQEASNAPQMTMRFDYVNYKGEIGTREVVPRQVFYGRNDWHTNGPDWFLQAFDMDKNAVRDFRMADIYPEGHFNGLKEISREARIVDSTMDLLRFAGMDQNPKGLRDILGNIAFKLEVMAAGKAGKQ